MFVDYGYAEELKDQPDVRAKLLCTIGDIYGKLGLYDEAQPLLEDVAGVVLAHADDLAGLQRWRRPKRRGG